MFTYIREAIYFIPPIPVLISPRNSQKSCYSSEHPTTQSSRHIKLTIKQSKPQCPKLPSLWLMPTKVTDPANGSQEGGQQAKAMSVMCSPRYIAAHNYLLLFQGLKCPAAVYATLKVLLTKKVTSEATSFLAPLYLALCVLKSHRYFHEITLSHSFIITSCLTTQKCSDRADLKWYLLAILRITSLL